MDSEPEDESESNSDEEDQEDEGKKTQVLLAEKRLCELAGKVVLAILASVFPDSDTRNTHSAVKERVQRNRTRLGGSFAAVVGFLDEPKAQPSKKKNKKAGGKKKVVSVSSGSEDDEGGEGEGEGEEEEGDEGGELADDRIEEVEDAEVAEVGGRAEEEDEIMGD